ncbi:hypothetical protein CFC21_017733 [Triticum aestivum]|uniref:GTD-binding domain-containing protein n=2 Tax=Triticum aestivum TaxID=4565 RepID=A0A9R1J2U2_WHEAT|nr:protein FLOURY 1-like [Triticum aestivum]KAF7002225.1 hypothetical protein CFC21_017733 [Triticum aestivum]
MGGWNRISSAGGLLKPLAGVPFASMPGAGAAYFLVGSALGVFAMLHASESEVGREWAFAARLAALYRSVGAHYVLDVMSFLLLAAKVWRLGKRCDVVEGLVGGPGPTVQAVRVRGVVCTVCGSGTKARALKNGSSGHIVEHSRSGSCSGKHVSRSLASELEQEADTEDEDIANEVTDAEESNLERLRRRLVRERRLKEAALEELEKERCAAASAADEAMAKIACLRNEKALVEREDKQFREMAQQKQMYDRQVIESLQWMINKFGMQS